MSQSTTSRRETYPPDIILSFVISCTMSEQEQPTQEVPQVPALSAETPKAEKETTVVDTTQTAANNDAEPAKDKEDQNVSQVSQDGNDASDKPAESAKPEQQDSKNNNNNNRGRKERARVAEYDQKDFKKRKPERPERNFEPCPTLYDKDGNVIPKEERRPKKKVAMMIGYCGTGYHGMQLNPPNPTIEGAIFDALVKAEAISKANSTDLKKNAFMRAARTDKGVHAAGNVISLKIIMEDPKTVEKINSFLPDQIRVWGIERVNKSFDCRKMCSSRVYEYLLPTYALLPPKPTSVLGSKIKEANEKTPGITRDDPEGEEWWEKVNKELLAEGITQEEIDKTHQLLRETEKFDEKDENFKFIRRVKHIENRIRRSYRVSESRLELFRQAMNLYLGHHNFHNFTVGKHFKDPSAGRYMISTKVSDPFVIENTEWVSIKIHGQSFMLHQIRKMIGMATLVVRTGCPLGRIVEAFDEPRINVPKAPALGLLLECPVYTGYNSKLQKFGYNELNFDNFETEMLEFKKKFIYDKIYAEEVKENTFYGFYGFIDNFNGDPIFDFLTAKGISGSANVPVKEIEVPNEKEEEKAAIEE